MASALTAAPITAPLSPLMPLGRSTASTHAPDRLIAGHSPAAIPSSGPIETGAEQGVDHNCLRTEFGVTGASTRPA